MPWPWSFKTASSSTLKLPSGHNLWSPYPAPYKQLCVLTTATLSPDHPPRLSAPICYLTVILPVHPSSLTPFLPPPPSLFFLPIKVFWQILSQLRVTQEEILHACSFTLKWFWCTIAASSWCFFVKSCDFFFCSGRRSSQGLLRNKSATPRTDPATNLLVIKTAHPVKALSPLPSLTNVHSPQGSKMLGQAAEQITPLPLDSHCSSHSVSFPKLKGVSKNRWGSVLTSRKEARSEDLRSKNTSPFKPNSK